MIQTRTVFVLGAGANCPYGFPTAKGLREQILSSFVNRYTQFLGDPSRGIGAGRTASGYPSLDEAKRFVECFDLSSTKSIDLFLSRNPRFEKIGKMAICLSILYAERYCDFREQIKKAEAEHDWYFYLYDRLTRDATGKDDYSQLAENRVTFVTFNYDRSLEHFLFTSLLHSFEGIDEQRTKEELRRKPVIHVYGKPASLPWERDDGQGTLPYASQIDDFASVDLLGISNNIYVVHGERINPNLESARKKVHEADHVFFLGFGYAKENLEILGLPGVLRRDHQIYGTALGWTDREINGIRNDFLDGLRRSGRHTLGVGDQVQIEQCDCVALLREFL